MNTLHSAAPRVRSRIPQRSSATIRRRRLLTLLEPTSGRNAITVVTAPAGSGKTTLLVDWVHAIDAEDATFLAWITIDESDNDVAMLRACVVAALAQCGSPQLASAVGSLPSVGDPSYSEFSALLVEAVESVDAQICLIFDDAHLLHNREVLALLGTFLRWPPCNLRIIVAGRFEPPLALQKPRLDGLVRDISAADLAFTTDEASEMFQRSGIALARGDLVKVMNRTEGWAAGLRLAAMTLSGGANSPELIDGFTGTQHTVADYLVNEILAGLPDDARTFLIETSVPEWFTTDLAEKLTGLGGAQATIDHLLAQNFLIDQMPGSEPTYRYHPLMRGYLRAEICRLGAGQIRSLERVASSWFSDYRQPLHALQHSVHAGDSRSILDIVGTSGLGLVLRGHASEVLTAIDDSPAPVHKHEIVQLISAAALLAIGSVAPATSTLTALRRRPVDELAGFDLDFEILRRTLEVHAAVQVGNDIEGALCRLRELEFGESGSPELDSYALLIAGLAELHLGRSTEAQRCLEDAVANGRAGHLPSVVTTCLVTSAGICFLTGRLTEATARGRRAVIYARLHSLSDTPLFAVAESLELLVAHIQMMPMSVAPEKVWSSIGRSADSAVSQYGKRAALVLDGTIEDVSAAGRDWLESVHPVIPAYEALLAPMVQRRYLTAGETLWATELVAVTRRRLGKVGEVALLTAEIHRMHGRFEAADTELAPVLAGQLRCASFTTPIRTAITAAKVALARRNPARAFELVCRALTEAEPEAILLPFAEGGATVRDILTHNRGRFGLLETFADRARDAVPRHPAAAESAMSGALTRRELELLRELPSWRTAEQIASDHFVSVNTVKTHLRGIYRKLEVRSRRDAIAAAHELGLL